MKLLVSYLYSTGGSLASSSLLLQTLARNYAGDRFHIVCSSMSDVRSKLAQSPNVEILPQTDIIHREVNRWLLGYWHLPKLARRTNADLLWSMNIGSYRRVTVPQLLTITNSFQVYPWNEVKNLATKGKIHLAVHRRVFRLSLRHADRVIVQSELIRSYVRQELRFQGPVDVIPKSVETADDIDFKPMEPRQQRLLAKSAGSKGAFTFLYLATCELHKNHALLVRVAKMLRERNLPIRIVVSVSEAELRSVGGEDTAEAIAGGHLVPLGWSDRERIKSVYDACDACVMPSLLESLSSAHLEAMRWGKPQISADLSYAHDLCGDSSLYAAPHDPTDWVDKMVLLSNDWALRQRLVAAGYDRMKLFPSRWKEVAERHHEIIRETISDWKKHPRR